MGSLEPHDEELTPQSGFKEVIRQPGTLVKIARMFFIFWGVCVVTGGATAVGLAHAGMKVQNAFYSGLTIGLLPFIAAGIIAVILMILG